MQTIEQSLTAARITGRSSMASSIVWMRLVHFVLLSLSVVFCPLDLGDESYVFGRFQPAVISMKLMLGVVVILLGLRGFLFESTVRKSLMSFPGLMLFFILCLATLVSPWAAYVEVAFPAAVINLGYLLFTITTLNMLGIRTFASAVAIGVAVSCMLLVVLYLISPASVVFLEPLADGQFAKRLSGLGHPNSVARTAAFGIICLIYLGRARQWPLILVFGLLVLMLGVEYFAKSRTAIFALSLAVVGLYSDRLLTRPGLAAISMAAVAVLLGMMVLVATESQGRLVNRALTSVAKSGDAEEITTATGRIQIWKETIKLVRARPLTGWGLNAGPKLLEEYLGSAHNALLYVGLSTGVLGALAMLGLLGWNLFLATTSTNLLVRAICTLVLVSGLTEETVFETFPGPTTICWYAACMFPIVTQRIGSSQTKVVDQFDRQARAT